MKLCLGLLLSIYLFSAYRPLQKYFTDLKQDLRLTDELKSTLTYMCDYIVKQPLGGDKDWMETNPGQDAHTSH